MTYFNYSSIYLILFLTFLVLMIGYSLLHSFFNIDCNATIFSFNVVPSGLLSIRIQSVFRQLNKRFHQLTKITIDLFHLYLF